MEQHTSNLEALTHKSDDSALNVREVGIEQKADEFGPSPLPVEVDGRYCDLKAADPPNHGSRDSSHKDKREQEKSYRVTKSKGKDEKSRRNAVENALPPMGLPVTTQKGPTLHESSTAERSSRVPQPRSVLRHRAPSRQLSEGSEISSQPDEQGTPEALFDMYNSLYAEVLPELPILQPVRSQAPPIFASAETARDYGTLPRSVQERNSPPTSVREYITPPGSVQDFDMFTARAPGSVSGLHMGNLFSFRSDTGQRAAPERSPQSEILSPASSVGRAGWRTMLSEWEERQDRDIARQTSSRQPSHSPHTSHESFS